MVTKMLLQLLRLRTRPLKEAAKARDVLITEIMAARNTAKVGTGQDGYLKHQWIEIYNKLSG